MEEMNNSYGFIVGDFNGNRVLEDLDVDVRIVLNGSRSKM
jgi:hypothetical protein